MKKHHKIILTIATVATIATTGIYLSNQKVGPNEIYPNSTLTPGLANPDINQNNIKDTICNPNWSTKSIRPSVSYTNALKQHQINSGYTYQGDTNLSDYELDHLISLTDGGNPTDPKNLWPEPYNTQINGKRVGAKEKDKLEVILNKKICSGELTLKEAQDILAHDWYKSYLDYGLDKNLGSINETIDVDDN